MKASDVRFLIISPVGGSAANIAKRKEAGSKWATGDWQTSFGIFERLSEPLCDILGVLFNNFERMRPAANPFNPFLDPAV